MVLAAKASNLEVREGSLEGSESRQMSRYDLRMNLEYSRICDWFEHMMTEFARLLLRKESIFASTLTVSESEKGSPLHLKSIFWGTSSAKLVRLMSRKYSLWR